MAEQWTPTTQRRVTLVSLLEITQGDYDAARELLDRLIEDGFFEEERPTPARSSGQRPTSGRQGSSSRPSNRGRDQQRQPFTGQMRDPDGPPTEKQVGLVLKNSDDYTEDELFDMTKQQVSDLIQDLIG